MNKEEIEKILQDFTHCLESTVTIVEVEGIKREATSEDQVEFIKSCWEDASNKLYDLEIDTNY